MKVKLPAIFSDGMVIGKSAKIWGWAGENQSVTADFLGNKYETLSDKTGRFEFTLKSEEFGGPFVITIEDKIISDVYVGRVWLCGGQSNMEGPVSRTRLPLGEYIKDDPRIRVFTAEKGLNFEHPQTDVNGKWNTATGDFLDEMFAVPYFFARNLICEAGLDDAPIGLVCIAAGGIPIEGFLPEKIVREHPEIHERLLLVNKPGEVKRTTLKDEKITQAWHNALNENDKGLQEGWFSSDYDDSNWQTRALLDPTGSPQHGAVWMRKDFCIDNDSTDGEFILNFGRVENSITVYINGVQVTDVAYMYPPCQCAVPSNLLIAGENKITIRVVGDRNNPCIVPGKEYSLLYPGGRVDFLTGKWKWRVGAEAEACPPNTYFFDYPCGVYNFMLAPLLGYSAEGLIWYQGESNTARPHSYKSLFTKFANHIRENFGNIPIIFTQLANYVDPHGSGENWAVLREQQRQCLSLPDTAMAVAIDCGEYNDLHPSDKKSVGDRLALHARRIVYGEDIISDGPIVKKVEYIEAEQKVIIHFKHSEGLWAKNGRPTLQLLYKDGTVHNVFAAIRGNTLEATVGTSPRTVRFGWADCPAVPIYNAYGLPASPFEVVI